MEQSVRSVRRPEQTSPSPVQSSDESLNPVSPQTAEPPPRLAVQAFWLTASKIAAALLNIVTPMLLVRFMSQNEYGIYKQVFLFVGTTVAMSNLGVGNSVFYFLPRFPGRGGQIVFNIILYNLLIGGVPLLILLVYPGVLRDVFHVPGLQPYAVALGVIVMMQACSTFIHQAPSALQDVRNSTVMIVGTQLLRAMMFMAAALLMPTVASLMAATILNQVMQNGALFWYLHRKFGRFWANFEWPFFMQQIRHAVPLGAFGILGVLRRDLHNYFVSAAFSPAQFAIYSVGCLQTPFVPVIVESVTTVMVVRVNQLQHERRHREILELTARTINRVGSVLLPLVALLFVTRRDLIVLFYTRAYEQSAQIYAVNLLLLGLSVFTFEPIIQSYKEIRKFTFTIQLAVFAAMTALLYVAIGKLGMVGAILVAVGANFVERIGVGCAAAKMVGAGVKDLALFGELVRVGGVAIAAAVAGSFVRDLLHPDFVLLRLVAAGACVAAVYAGGMWLFRLPGHEFLSPARISALWRSVRNKLRDLRR